MASKKFSLAIVMSAVDKVTAPLRGVQQKFKSLGDTVDRQKSKLSLQASALGIPALGKSITALKDPLKGAMDSVKDATVKIAAIGAIGVGAFLAIKDSADKLDSLKDFSKTVGINVRAIQEWRYAASQAGSSAEELDSGLRTFTLGMGKARAGSGKLLGFLNQINPAFKKQLLATKSNEEGFNLMMKAISKISDPQKRLALSTMAFGDAGESLARVAGEGTDALNKMREEARRLGLATEEDTDKADDFNDNLAKMTFALEAAKNRIAVSLMPMMSELFTKITKWVVENQVKIQQFGTYLAENLPKAIDKTIQFCKDLANSPITKFFMFIIEKIGYANALLGSLALYIGGPIVMSLAVLSKALMVVGWTFTKVIMGIAWVALKALFGLIVANPVGALIAALIAGGILIYKYWDDIKQLFSDIWGWVQKILGAGWDKIKNVFSSIGNFFGGKGASVNVAPVKNIVGADNLGAQQLGQRYFDNNQKTQEANVKVSFDNLPKGSRIQTEKSTNSNIDLSMGYSMVGP